MGKGWIKKQKNEKFYRQAQKEGMRSRAAFKLRQIQAKFKIFNNAKLVLDLCCSPGSWIQEIQREFTDISIIGVDLVKMKPFDNVTFIQGDIRSENLISQLETEISGKVDTIISDCAPKITGVKETDSARQIFLIQRVLELVAHFLKKEGHFVCKLFDGDYTTRIRDQLKQYFEKVSLFKPEASRKKSPELYIVGKTYKKTQILKGLS